MKLNKFKRPFMKNDDYYYVMSFQIHHNQGFHELMSNIIEEHKEMKIKQVEQKGE